MRAHGLREFGGTRFMQKGTRVSVYPQRLATCFEKRCPGNRDRVTIEGKPSGVSRSTWVGRSTLAFCEAILRSTGDLAQFWAVH
eukprot:3708138-Pyramimonas_sp.AAC.1